MITTLYYVHDPMCSWCWAFRPVWENVQTRLPTELPVKYVLGGLAPDSQDPMPDDMQSYLQQTWRNIQNSVPGTQFNFDFWTNNTPRRSTYPACRAVISAANQNPEFEVPMTLSIQEAYYLNAINPSDDDNLIQLAVQLGLDSKQFMHDLNSEHTQHALMEDIALHQQLGAQGFPSLILVHENRAYSIPVSYTDAAQQYTRILSALG